MSDVRVWDPRGPVISQVGIFSDKAPLFVLRYLEFEAVGTFDVITALCKAGGLRVTLPIMLIGNN